MMLGALVRVPEIEVWRAATLQYLHEPRMLAANGMGQWGVRARLLQRPLHDISITRQRNKSIPGPASDDGIPYLAMMKRLPYEVVTSRCDIATLQHSRGFLRAIALLKMSAKTRELLVRCRITVYKMSLEPLVLQTIYSACVR
jgi:hypothetical protein